MRVCLILLALSASLLVQPAGGEPVDQAGAEWDAKSILGRMADAYLDCETYRDEGFVTTVFFIEGGKRTYQKPFRTAFIRPDRFRYEFRDPQLGLENRYVVWRSGDEVKTAWTIKPGVEDQESLAMAVATATGVSGGSAHTIPTLLMPDEVQGWALTMLEGVERLADEPVDGNTCFVVSGVSPVGPTSVWIDRELFVVRKIESSAEFPDFRTETTISYEPAMDEPIAEDLLQLEPDDGE